MWFVVLFLVAFVLLFSPEGGRTNTFAQATSGTPPKAPIFISVVYPSLGIDRNLVDVIPTIADAYSFWGRTDAYSMVAGQKNYFPAPFSYPYQFSDRGVAVLESKLRSVPEIHPESISKKTFPNIHSERHEYYEQKELKDILINEQYLSFKFKSWNNVEFMKFPTFLVISFDFTGRYEAPYPQIRSDLRQKIAEFQKHKTLRNILDSSRQEQRRSNVPVLTFVALGFPFYPYVYSNIDDDFARSDIKRRFLGNISVRTFSKPIDPNDFLIRFCGDIVYETRIPTSRYYYAESPIFLDRRFASRSVQSPLYSSMGSLNRILRTVLFTHVTLPSIATGAKDVDGRLRRMLSKIRQDRIALSKEFSPTRLAAFESLLNEATSPLENQIESTLDRIDEAKNGYEQLMEDAESPFLESKEWRAVADKRNAHCPEPFEIAEGRVDHRKIIHAAAQIEKYGKEINLNRERLAVQVASAATWIANENALRASRQNTDRAIKWALFIAVLGAILSPFLGAAVGRLFDYRSAGRIDEKIQDAIAEQQKQTEIQADLKNKANKMVQELSEMSASFADVKDRLNEQKKKENELTANVQALREELERLKGQKTKHDELNKRSESVDKD
jgi:hypothetical protein